MDISQIKSLVSPDDTFGMFDITYQYKNGLNLGTNFDVVFDCKDKLYKQKFNRYGIPIGSPTRYDHSAHFNRLFDIDVYI